MAVLISISFDLGDRLVTFPKLFLAQFLKIVFVTLGESGWKLLTVFYQQVWQQTRSEISVIRKAKEVNRIELNDMYSIPNSDLGKSV